MFHNVLAAPCRCDKSSSIDELSYIHKILTLHFVTNQREPNINDKSF